MMNKKLNKDAKPKGLVKKLLVKSKKFAISSITSPTTVWFSSLYIFSLLSIIIFNIVRLGDLNAVFSAPGYYSSLFLHYGLNAESSYTSPYTNGVLSWLFAPFLVIFMGLPLFFLKEAGWAYNSPFFEISQINQNYAFFSTNVFGYEIVFFGQKGNAFFLGMVWLPILCSTIVTVIYKIHTKRNTWVVTRFTINLLISFWLGLEMARMTDPNLYFDWSQFIPTLVDHRFTNNFVVFDGHYNPMMITILFTFFQILPMVILGLSEGGYKSLRIYIKKREIFKNEDDKTVKISTRKLPWIAESEEEIVLEDVIGNE